MESPFKYLGGCLWCFNQPVVSGRDVLGADWRGVKFLAILGKEMGVSDLVHRRLNGLGVELVGSVMQLHHVRLA